MGLHSAGDIQVMKQSCTIRGGARKGVLLGCVLCSEEKMKGCFKKSSKQASVFICPKSFSFGFDLSG